MSEKETALLQRPAEPEHHGTEYLEAQFAQHDEAPAAEAPAVAEAQPEQPEDARLHSLSGEELAIELVNAIESKDTLRADKLNAIASHKIMEMVTDPSYDTKDADGEYETKLTNFHAIVQELLETNTDAPVETPVATVEETPEEQAERAALTSRFGNALQQFKIPEQADDIVVTAPEVASTTPEAPTVELGVGAYVSFEGREGFVQDVFTNGSGDVMFEILDTSGELFFARKENVKDLDADEDDAEALVAAPLEATPVEGEVTDSSEVTEADAEKKSRVERVKDWFGKNKEAHKDKFSTAYWAARFSTAWNSMLDYRTNEDMSDAEIDRIRNINRKSFIIGSAAIGVLGLIGLGVSINESINADTAPVGNADGLGALAPDPNSLEATAAANAAAEAAQHAAEAEAATTALFDIPRGQGGLELFKNLGIDPSQWAANAPNFPSMFPNDFVAMDGGGVGIKHSGWISPEAQEFIKSLR